MDPTQRRRTPRIRLQFPYSLRVPDAFLAQNLSNSPELLNISANGACIASTRILRPEQIIHLTDIPLLHQPLPAYHPAKLLDSAKVLRQDAVGDLWLFGLEFLRHLSKLSISLVLVISSWVVLLHSLVFPSMPFTSVDCMPFFCNKITLIQVQPVSMVSQPKPSSMDSACSHSI